MLRGEFIRGDGLVIPNNIMTYGVARLFAWALAGEAYSLYMALANCNPTPTLNANALNEPTIGTNGYARQAIAQGAGWPTSGTFNGEAYLESVTKTFTATGPGFNKPIRRLALLTHPTNTAGVIVVALSAPLPAELAITPATDLTSRQFKYRIYGR